MNLAGYVIFANLACKLEAAGARSWHLFGEFPGEISR